MAPFFFFLHSQIYKLQGVSYPLDNVCHFSEFQIKKKILERAMTFYYLMKGPNWHTIAWDSYRYFGS